MMPGLPHPLRLLPADPLEGLLEVRVGYWYLLMIQPLGS